MSDDRWRERGERARRIRATPVLRAATTVFALAGGVAALLAGPSPVLLPVGIGLFVAVAGCVVRAIGRDQVAQLTDGHSRTALSLAAAATAAGLLPGLLVAISVTNRYGSPVRAVLAVGVAALAVGILRRAKARHLGTDLANAQRASDEAETVRSTLASGGHVPLLSATGIDFSYGQLQVLFGVDFTVDDGEMVALLGTNGAGKSTLLKVVSGIGLPAAGTVRFRGRDITYSDAERRVSLGITQVPGGRAVFGNLDVVENLRTFGYTLGRDRTTVDEAIERCFAAFPRLAERKRSLAANLSGGEQQMVGLSKALILQPRLLLIDELSLGLAPIVVGHLLDTVRAINATGTAVVLVEQSVNIALSLVEHAYFMEKGEMRFDGPAAELLERSDLLRAVFLEGATKAAGP